MKALTRIFPAALFAAIITVGCASTESSRYNTSDINQGVTASSVIFRVNSKGVATLSGTVDSYFDKNRLGNAANDLQGVTKVHNLLVFSQ